MSCNVDHPKIMRLLSEFKDRYKEIATERCKNDDEMFIFIYEMAAYSSLLLISLFDDMEGCKLDKFDKFIGRVKDKYKDEFDGVRSEQRAH